LLEELSELNEELLELESIELELLEEEELEEYRTSLQKLMNSQSI